MATLNRRGRGQARGGGRAVRAAGAVVRADAGGLARGGGHRAVPTVGAGLEAEDFSTITRDDGSKQVAFYGQPLYYFAADAAAGDVKGQGLNDKWYVVGADGTPIK